jgi:hypothetical protein
MKHARFVSPPVLMRSLASYVIVCSSDAAAKRMQGKQSVAPTSTTHCSCDGPAACRL